MNRFGDTVYLGIDLEWRGLWKGYFSIDNQNKLKTFSLILIYRDRSYFISNTSSLKPGLSYARDSLRQVENSPNIYPVCGEFEINQPRVAERYYSRNSEIDESNRTRQDDLQLQGKLQTKYWSIIVNTSILGMDNFDTYYLDKAFEWCYYRNSADFYYNLSGYMIDNRWTEISK